MSLSVRKRTIRHVRLAKIQISLRIRAVWSESSLDAFWIAKDASFLMRKTKTDAQADLNLHHYENTPIQIHWDFYHQKMKIFR